MARMPLLRDAVSNEALAHNSATLSRLTVSGMNMNVCGRLSRFCFVILQQKKERTTNKNAIYWLTLLLMCFLSFQLSFFCSFSKKLNLRLSLSPSLFYTANTVP